MTNGAGVQVDADDDGDAGGNWSTTVVVTRGGDGIFPAEIPVGVVASVEQPAGKTYQDIKVVLSEDLTRDGYVYVVYDLMRPERDSLQIRLDTE